MRKAVVSTKELKLSGPYSAGIYAGNFLYISGQLPITSEGDLIISGVKAQTKQVMENIKTIIESAKYSMKDIVKVNIYTINIDDLPKINEVYSQYFENEPPARALVGVSALSGGASVEIEAIAYKE